MISEWMQMQGWDVLFSEMTPAEPWEDEFNAWYDNEHIPLRMALEGFEGAQRYKRNERDYLTVYDLSGSGALETPQYRNLKNSPSALTKRMLDSVANFSRYVGKCIDATSRENKSIGASVLYAVFFRVPKGDLAAFDGWYERDHVPILMECEEWLACRRFDLVSSHPNPHNRLALHYLSSERALRSEARQRARETEWRQQLSRNDWFKPVYMVFQKHGERFHAPASLSPLNARASR
ncbi:hypothetical protein [Mesorhizobium sp. 1B3]|uniref:hypothetical protein n=1 Tax=Mesorhizobium sp. 1B3 TaxID=3243599 RepID=UPI003D97BAC2